MLFQDIIPPLRALPGIPGNERIVAISDAVFSFAITLLVLEIQVPANNHQTGFVGALPELVPKFASHVLSFMVLGMYWVGHHNQFKHIRRHDRILMWINLLFLMFVAAMPFFAGLLIEAPGDQGVVVAYATLCVAIGLSLEALWWYATHDRRLVNPDIDPNLVRYGHRRVLAAPALYLCAIALSFASVALVRLLFVVVPLLYILPISGDRYHHRELDAADV